MSNLSWGEGSDNIIEPIVPLKQKGYDQTGTPGSNHWNWMMRELCRASAAVVKDTMDLFHPQVPAQRGTVVPSSPVPNAITESKELATLQMSTNPFYTADGPYLFVDGQNLFLQDNTTITSEGTLYRWGKGHLSLTPRTVTGLSIGNGACAGVGRNLYLVKPDTDFSYLSRIHAYGRGTAYTSTPTSLYTNSTALQRVRLLAAYGPIVMVEADTRIRGFYDDGTQLTEFANTWDIGPPHNLKALVVSDRYVAIKRRTGEVYIRKYGADSNGDYAFEATQQDALTVASHMNTLYLSGDLLVVADAGPVINDNETALEIYKLSERYWGGVGEWAVQHVLLRTLDFVTDQGAFTTGYTGVPGVVIDGDRIWALLEQTMLSGTDYIVHYFVAELDYKSPFPVSGVHTREIEFRNPQLVYTVPGVNPMTHNRGNQLAYDRDCMFATLNLDNKTHLFRLQPHTEARSYLRNDACYRGTFLEVL